MRKQVKELKPGDVLGKKEFVISTDYKHTSQATVHIITNTSQYWWNPKWSITVY